MGNVPRRRRFGMEESMGMIVWKKLEKLAHQCFDGDVTMPKVWFWMIGAICLLSGIVYGLLCAPLTHGVTIGSNNGNNTNCGFEFPDAAEEDDKAVSADEAKKKAK